MIINMKTKTLNIAILPSDEVVIQAIAMSKKVAEGIGSRFVLNPESLIPHITVYQARYPSKNINKLKDIVRTLSLKQRLFKIKLDAISVSHETFLFWNCDKNQVLQGLQRKTVELANPLRQGLVPDYLANVAGLSKGDKYDVMHYGALLIGSRYEQHITITRLNKANDAEKATKILLGLCPRQLSFRPKGLFLGYLGEHGTVTGIIENFHFR
jgi:hypothetical protein